VDPAGPHQSDHLSPCCCHAQRLTEREVEVLCQLAAGLTNEEAARALHVSEHTVAGHIQAMRARFGARTRTDLVFRACAAGLLELAWPPRPTGRRCLNLPG
jgi:DNA-binding NarL/FixJ family response regulator